MTFDFETDSRYEPYLNYSLGAFTILCVLVSSALNPLILYFRNKKERTIKNFLFNVIAVSDFLTNLFPATFIGYVFLSSTKFDQYTLLNQIPEFFCCTLGCVSQVTVTLMAVTRMIKIIKPYLTIYFKWVLSYLVLYTIYMVLGNAGFLLYAGLNGSDEKAGKKTELAILDSWNTYVCAAMNMFHCFLGITSSFITVAYLRINMRGIGDQVSKVRGSNTILIMNIPYLISIVINFLVLSQTIKINVGLVNHYMIPILTSALNPAVVLMRTNTLRSDIAASTYQSGSQYGRLSSRHSGTGRRLRKDSNPFILQFSRLQPSSSLKCDHSPN